MGMSPVKCWFLRGLKPDTWLFCFWIYPTNMEIERDSTRRNVSVFAARIDSRLLIMNNQQAWWNHPKLGCNDQRESLGNISSSSLCIPLESFRCSNTCKSRLDDLQDCHHSQTCWITHLLLKCKSGKQSPRTPHIGDVSTDIIPGSQPLVVHASWIYPRHDYQCLFGPVSTSIVYACHQHPWKWFIISWWIRVQNWQILMIDAISGVRNNWFWPVIANQAPQTHQFHGWQVIIGNSWSFHYS